MLVLFCASTVMSWTNYKLPETDDQVEPAARVKPGHGISSAITGIGAILNYCPGCDLGSVGRVEEKEYWFDEAGQSMRYTLYVPKSYDPSQQTPMTVALHGLFGDPGIAYPMAPFAEKHGHILVCPMGYNKTSWFGAQEITSDLECKVLASQAPLDVTSINDKEAGKLGYKDVMNVIQIVQKDYNVDPRRMYLAGHSMGGGGVYYIATKTPDMWAALGTMAPGIAASAAYLDVIKHIPVICLQGLKDTIVPSFISKYWSETMNYFGMQHKYIEYKNADHLSIVLRAGELFKFFDMYNKE